MSLGRRMLCVSPLILAVSLWVVDPVLARLLVPFREVLLALLALQLLIGLAWIRPMKWRLGIAGVAAAGIAIVVAGEYDVAEKWIAFDSDGTTLAGTLYRPKTDGEHPALVVVHGSGKFPRRMYRYWGQEFARLGFNVLVYDKRGVGDSGGKYEGENNTSDENIRLLAADAAHAVDVVASLPDTTAHIGLFGVSQGGWIAPLAAEMNPKVKFLVLHSGPVVSVGQQNLFEQRQLVSSRSAGFDPPGILAKLPVRSLWLFGGDDHLVPVRSSMASLQTLIADGKAFEYHLMPAADHLLLTTSTRFSSRASREYWSSIVGWMETNRHRQL